MFLKKRPVIALSSNNNLLNSAYVYAEIHRLRERIVNTLKEQKQKTVLVTSPHDDAGNTFLVSVLGLNVASFSKMRVLLVDLNMRRPQLHVPFGLKPARGFSEVAAGLLSWKDTVKDTSLSRLKIVTGGRPDPKLSRFLKRSLLEGLIREMKEHFDLILFDTSPVLVQNRNNVDPALLSLVWDMVIIVAQDKKTTKTELENTVGALPQGRGKVSGIVYNHRF